MPGDVGKGRTVETWGVGKGGLGLGWGVGKGRGVGWLGLGSRESAGWAWDGSRRRAAVIKPACHEATAAAHVNRPPNIQDWRGVDGTSDAGVSAGALPASGGSITPRSGLRSQSRFGGCDQSSAPLKSTVPPENRAPLKPTQPPENLACLQTIVRVTLSHLRCPHAVLGYETL